MKMSSAKLHSGALGTLSALLPVVCLVSPAAAQPSPNDPDATFIYRTQVAQEEVLSDTKAFVNELQSLLSELQTSGLSSQAAPEAQRAAAELSAVASEQMEEVVAMLGSARTSEGNEARRRLLEALRAQTTISQRLELLVAKLEAKRDFESLSGRLADLLQRQVRVRYTVAPYAASGQPKGNNNDAERAALEAAALQQERLAADTQSLPDLFQRLKVGMDGARAVQVTQVEQLFQNHRAPEAAQAALEHLRQAQWAEAVRAQTALEGAYAAMLAVLRGTDPAAKAAAMLATAESLQALSEEQSGLAKRTEDADKRDATRLAAQVRDLAIRTDAARRELEAMAPAVSRQLENALGAMEQASQLIAKRNPSLAEAAQQQQSAADILADAAQSLQSAAMAAQTQPPATPDQRHRQLAELARATEQAQRNHQEIAAQESAAAAQQGQNAEQATDQIASQRQALAEAVRGLQQNAAAVSPLATEALAQAAEAMEASVGSPASAQSQAASAQEALAQAAQTLQSEMQAIAAAAAESRQIQNAAAQLDTALQHTEAANSALASSAPNAEAAAAAALRQAAQSAQAAAALAANQDAAAQAARQAAQALLQASLQSTTGNTQAATESSAQAMGHLQNAQQALAERMAQISGPQTPAQQMAEAGGQPGEASAQDGSGQDTSSVPTGEGAVQGFIPNTQDDGAEVVTMAGVLSPAEREALRLMRNEPVPPGYEAAVEQYFIRLAGADGKSSGPSPR